MVNPMNKSPFPGMDPFLEDSAEWGGVHTWLITAIGEQLASVVSPDFSVKIEQRVYIALPDDFQKYTIVPDLYIIQNPPQAPVATGTLTSVTAPTLVEPWYDPEIRERYIDIRDKRSREIITTIEILSPFNKAPGTPGREAFLQKRRNVTASHTHWVEIDLLRAGERPGEVANKSDYYALLKRGGTFGPFEVWYFDLRDRMPTIAIPLRPPFEDVPLDLQAAFEDSYRRGHYADDIDYAGRVPPPALRPADANWIQSQLIRWHA